jgi:hypothetical protein
MSAGRDHGVPISSRYRKLGIDGWKGRINPQKTQKPAEESDEQDWIPMPGTIHWTKDEKTGEMKGEKVPLPTEAEWKAIAPTRSVPVTPITFRDMKAAMHNIRAHVPMLLIFDHPADFSEKYVAQLWWFIPAPYGTTMILYSEYLQRLREGIKSHLHMEPITPRKPICPDPTLIETWL